MSRATKEASQGSEGHRGHQGGQGHGGGASVVGTLTRPRVPRHPGGSEGDEALTTADGSIDGGDPITADEDGPLLTLKEMVRGARTTARAVRFYEEQHLIATAGRSPGGHRLFAADELPKLKLVLELRTCGFSIEEIREVLEAKSRHNNVREAAGAVQGILRHHMKELEQKIATIQRLGREFSQSLDLLDRCVHCIDPRGPEACSTCDLPRGQVTPSSFCHIWGVAVDARTGRAKEQGHRTDPPAGHPNGHPNGHPIGHLVDRLGDLDAARDGDAATPMDLAIPLDDLP